jgi:PHD/YefM family antitoxin component YafN of YafNO toxin-antitoxin module
MEAKMANTTQEVQTLANFHANSVAAIARLKETHQPLMLIVDGEPEIVVQEAAAYQRLLDLAALADPEEGLRQGLEEIAEGRTHSAREVFTNFREKYNIRG